MVSPISNLDYRNDLRYNESMKKNYEVKRFEATKYGIEVTLLIPAEYLPKILPQRMSVCDCGTPFAPTDKRHIHCSQACKQRAFRIKKTDGRNEL
jgi:hypothetical protein